MILVKALIADLYFPLQKEIIFTFHLMDLLFTKAFSGLPLPTMHQHEFRAWNTLLRSPITLHVNMPHLNVDYFGSRQDF